MEITFNGLSNPSNLICFDGVPNIIKVKDVDSGGTYGMITLSFKSGLTATGDSQYSITILDNTITNVLNPAEAVGQNFFIASDRASTAYSVARALRACPNVTANYRVLYSNFYIRLQALQKGSIFYQYAISAQTNIPSDYLTLTANDGTSTSRLANTNVSVDMWIGSDLFTTMQKNAQQNGNNVEVAFDISSALGSRAEYGKVSNSFTFNISTLDNTGTYYSLYYGGNYNTFTHGYKTKDSYNYLTLSSTPQIALAVDRGKSRNQFNNTILYVYEPSIPLSVYSTQRQVTATVKFLDSAYNTIDTETHVHDYGSVFNYLHDFDNKITNTAAFNQAFYIDVTIGSDTLRYNVIKPLKMTEECTRLYWRNEYGGIQFFDFTGQKSQTDEREEDTYHIGNAIFDYYEYSSDEKRYEGVYNINVNERINVSSHLIEKSGIWQFDSLIRAKKVWTVIDGVKYGVIIDSVSVEETEQNDVYRANVTFHTAELQS